jgi:hypothetical protein
MTTAPCAIVIIFVTTKNFDHEQRIARVACCLSLRSCIPTPKANNDGMVSLSSFLQQQIFF